MHFLKTFFCVTAAAFAFTSENIAAASDAPVAPPSALPDASLPDASQVPQAVVHPDPDILSQSQRKFVLDVLEQHRVMKQGSVSFLDKARAAALLGCVLAGITTWRYCVPLALTTPAATAILFSVGSPICDFIASAAKSFRNRDCSIPVLRTRIDQLMAMGTEESRFSGVKSLVSHVGNVAMVFSCLAPFVNPLVAFGFASPFVLPLSWARAVIGCGLGFLAKRISPTHAGTEAPGASAQPAAPVASAQPAAPGAAAQSVVPEASAQSAAPGAAAQPAAPGASAQPAAPGAAASQTHPNRKRGLGRLVPGCIGKLFGSRQSPRPQA